MEKVISETKTEMMLRFLMEELSSRSYRVSKMNAWVTTWHLREDTGYSTAQINYHLNKLANLGVLVKKVSVYCTQFRPRMYEGFRYENEYFVRVPDVDKGKSINRVHKGYRVGSSDWEAQLNMLLSDGIKCSDCQHENRCNTMFDGNSDNTECQFHPNRFTPKQSADKIK